MTAALAHALVVGGSGMLAAACVELSRRGMAVSVLARRRGPLERLAAAAADPRPDVLEIVGRRFGGVTADYRDPAALDAALAAAQAARGPVSLVVAWIHAVAPQAPLHVARALSAEGRPLRYVHVLGSAVADPSRPDDTRRAAFEALPGLAYEEVILGFIVRRGRARWLTDAEISRGVLAAIDRPAPRSVVGTVTPWSARP